MAKFAPTDTQARIAARVGYAIDGENKWMLRGRLGYEIDTAKSGDESFSVKADWIGPADATDCEMKLWRALVDAMSLSVSMTDDEAAMERACRAICGWCQEGKPLTTLHDGFGDPYGSKVWHIPFPEHPDDNQRIRCLAEKIRKEFKR
jgi:hypothetical protein